MQQLIIYGHLNPTKICTKYDAFVPVSPANDSTNYIGLSNYI